MRIASRLGHGKYWRLKLLAFMGILVLLGWFLLGKLEHVFFNLRIQTVEATFGTEETRVEGRATILRRERVVRAQAPGRVTLLVGEGRRVRANDIVCELNDEDDVGPVPVGLERINREINQLEAATEAERGRLEQRRLEIESRLEDAERVVKDALASGDSDAVREAEARRDGFLRELEAIDREVRELERARSEKRERLLEERQSLLRMRPSDVMLVRAPDSGYVSFSFDGLEDEHRPGAELVTAEKEAPVQKTRVADGLRVAKGEPLFRLVDGDRLEVLVRIRSRLPLKAGWDVTLAFGQVPKRAFQGRLEQVLVTERETLARVRIDGFDRSLIHFRYDDVVLSMRRAQGISVPAGAVIEVDGKTGLYVMVGDRPVFRRVRVLGGNAERVIVDGVDGVPVGAPVVVNPGLVAKRRH